MQQQINWIYSLEQIINKKKKTTTVYKGIAELGGQNYYLDYLPTTNFVWWIAIPIDNNVLLEYSKEHIKKYVQKYISEVSPPFLLNLQESVFYNVSFAPTNIQSLFAIYEDTRKEYEKP